ncbi:MAG: hypothetical protein IJ744_12515 [Lachnospiraceae bacterium]|nr:hypothetical protein [Lachnospiraceae bacterium]
MSDEEKREWIYKTVASLDPEDALEMMRKSKSEDQRRFFETVSNYLLQEKQRKAIEERRF